MWRAAWKSVLGHKGRLALSMIAVALGTAFMVGALTFTGMLAQIFEIIGKGSIADVQVERKGSYDQGAQSNLADYEQGRLTEADLAKLRTVPGVQSVEGLIVSTDLYPLNAKGKVISVGGAPAMTFSWIEGAAYARQPSVVIQDGRRPQSGDEAALDPATLRASGKQLNDVVEFVMSDGTKLSKRIVGTATWGSGGSAGVQYVFLTPTEAQHLFLNDAKEYLTGWVAIKEGEDRAEVAKRLNAVVPEGYQAYDGDLIFEKVSTALDEGLTFINTFLLVFAAVGLVVAVFLIVNTFSILVAQRGRELALYRALGAGRGQVQRIVLAEALITGLLGSIFGVFLGMALAGGIAALMTALGMDMSGTIPVPTWQDVLAAIAVGTLVTLISAWWPAAKAGRIPPVQAMTGVTEKSETKAGAAEWISVALIVLGAVCLGLAATKSVPNHLWVLGAGAVLTLVGVAGVAPVIGRPLTWTLGRGYRALFKQTGKLADLNVTRQPRRTAATAAALMIGLTLVTLLSTLGSSASASVRQTINDLLPADYQISTINYSAISKRVLPKIEAVEGVGEVHPVYGTVVKTADGKMERVAGYATSSFGKTFALSIIEGREYQSKGEAVVLERTANRHGWQVGDLIKIPSPAGDIELRITGIATLPKGTKNGPPINVDVATVQQLNAGDDPLRISVMANPDADKVSVKQALEDATQDMPLITVADSDEYAEAQAASIDSLLNVIYALLGLAIVIAILGIVNTLLLSIIERTREIGLLRAVGLQRRQLRLMISLESIAMALLGAALGMALGLVFGVLLRAQLADDGLTVLSIPWPELLIFLAGSIVVGVLAAVGPGRRAAKMDILAAIATD